MRAPRQIRQQREEFRVAQQSRSEFGIFDPREIGAQGEDGEKLREEDDQAGARAEFETVQERHVPDGGRLVGELRAPGRDPDRPDEREQHLDGELLLGREHDPGVGESAPPEDPGRKVQQELGHLEAVRDRLEGGEAVLDQGEIGPLRGGLGRGEAEPIGE